MVILHERLFNRWREAASRRPGRSVPDGSGFAIFCQSCSRDHQRKHGARSLSFSCPIRVLLRSLQGFSRATPHNPKVGGSNPPPATNLIIGLQAKLLFPARAKRGTHGCYGGLFHFASLSAGRRAICTTLLLAARFDS